MVDDPPDINPYEPSSAIGHDTSGLDSKSASDLTTGDWLLAVFCSGIACIIGIVRLLQRKPSGAKLIAISFLFGMLWAVLRAGISMSTMPRP